jgi:hypothetical protein
MRKNRWVLVALLLVSAGVELPTTPAVADAIDPSEPCSLLTPSDVSKAFKHDVRKGREVLSRPNSDGEQVPLCIYRTGPPYTSLAIYVERPVTRRDFQERMERDPRNTKELGGLGDQAFIHAGVSLSVLEGDTVVDATVQHFDTVQRTQVVLRKVGSAAVRRIQN